MIAKAVDDVIRQPGTTETLAWIDAVKADIHMVAFWEDPSIARSDRGEIEDQIIVART